MGRLGMLQRAIRKSERELGHRRQVIEQRRLDGGDTRDEEAALARFEAAHGELLMKLQLYAPQS
jgi:hypothetical protein